MSKVSIKGIDKASVLAALYNAAQPQGMGFMHYDPEPMTIDQAKALIEGGHTRFDYLKGRVMKVDISKDEFDPWGYDRDNGAGAAQRAIDSVVKTGNVNNAEIAETHRINTEQQVEELAVRAGVHQRDTV